MPWDLRSHLVRALCVNDRDRRPRSKNPSFLSTENVYEIKAFASRFLLFLNQTFMVQSVKENDHHEREAN